MSPPPGLVKKPEAEEVWEIGIAKLLRNFVHLGSFFFKTNPRAKERGQWVDHGTRTSEISSRLIGRDERFQEASSKIVTGRVM